MTTYWKSTPKHFCKYCNCWLTDSKSAIFRHENGRIHKEKMELYYKSKKDEKEKEHKQKSQTAAALRAIEKAAKAAYNNDVAGMSNSNAIFISESDKEAHRLASLAPPPAPALPAYKADNKRRSSSTPVVQSKSGSHAPPRQSKGSRVAPAVYAGDPFVGQYVVDGKVFLEGEHYAQIMARNMPCEVWVDAQADWVPAVISAVTEIAIPNTDQTLRQFTVKYQEAAGAGAGAAGGDTEGGSSKSVNNGSESGGSSSKAAPGRRVVRVVVVRANALRLVPALPPPEADKKSLRLNAKVAEAKAQGRNAQSSASAVSSSTGYGEWSMVTLTVSETQERDNARSDAVSSVFKSITAKQKKKKQPSHVLPIGEEEAEGTMDAFAQYNPHGGAYRGVEVVEETATLGALRDAGEDNTGSEEGAGAAPRVVFKKRKKKKKLGGAAKKPKMLRRKSLDD